MPCCARQKMLSALCSVLCAVGSMLYASCSVLLCSPLYALCPMLHALCFMLCALCSMLYACYSMLHALYAQCPMLCAAAVCSMLATVCCMLYVVCFVLHLPFHYSMACHITSCYIIFCLIWWQMVLCKGLRCHFVPPPRHCLLRHFSFRCCNRLKKGVRMLILATPLLEHSRTNLRFRFKISSEPAGITRSLGPRRRPFPSVCC